MNVLNSHAIMVSKFFRILVGVHVRYIATWCIYPLEFDFKSLQLSISSSKRRLICKFRFYFMCICNLILIARVLCDYQFLAPNSGILFSVRKLNYVGHLTASVLAGSLIDAFTWLNLEEIVTAVNSTFLLYDKSHQQRKQTESKNISKINPGSSRRIYFIVAFLCAMGSIFYPSFGIFAYAAQCEVHMLAYELPICVKTSSSSISDEWDHISAIWIVPLAFCQFLYSNNYACVFSFHLLLLPQKIAVIEMTEQLRSVYS